MLFYVFALIGLIFRFDVNVNTYVTMWFKFYL